MAYDFKKLKAGVEETRVWLEKEFFGIRTGRAAPALLDNVRVEAYGSKLPINQVATVGVEDARTLRVTPFDVTQAKEIERAIAGSNLGVSATVDDRGVRVTFPELTSERREQFLKLVNQKLEDARVSLRKVRDGVWDDIQEKTKRKEIGEDDKFKFKTEMQKLIDEGNHALETMAKKKEGELSR